MTPFGGKAALITGDWGGPTRQGSTGGYEAWKARVIQATEGRVGMRGDGGVALTGPSPADGGDR